MDLDMSQNIMFVVFETQMTSTIMKKLKIRLENLSYQSKATIDSQDGQEEVKTMFQVMVLVVVVVGVEHYQLGKLVERYQKRLSLMIL